MCVKEVLSSLDANVSYALTSSVPDKSMLLDADEVPTDGKVRTMNAFFKAPVEYELVSSTNNLVLRKTLARWKSKARPGQAAATSEGGRESICYCVSLKSSSGDESSDNTTLPAVVTTRIKAAKAAIDVNLAANPGPEQKEHCEIGSHLLAS